MITIVAIGVATSLFLGCGIPSYPSLIAPDTVLPTSPESGLEFTFMIPTANDDDIFEGFELYYKLYTGTQEADGLIELESGSVVDFATLQQAGFASMLDASDSSGEAVRPLLPLSDDVENDATAELVLDFSPIIAAEPSQFPEIVIEDVVTRLARNRAVPGNQAVAAGFFTDDFAAADGDIPIGYDPESVNPEDLRIYIAMYILSYGNDIPSLEFNIYSQPSFAGYIAIPGQ